MAGFFDYGPLGVEIKNNIKKLWWRDMVQRREVLTINSPAPSLIYSLIHSLLRMLLD